MGEGQERDAHDRFLQERHRPAHARRRADRWAAFLLPHLRPGMRLLDVGCGPGSITTGLAEVVAPGLAVGIDPDRDRMEGATTTVATAVGEQLPFPDGVFDAVFMCAVLQHVVDPTSVLREARRVARPGAVVGVADADWDGFLVHPPDPLLLRGQEVLAALRASGDPGIGKRLRDLLDAAGFVGAVASATTTAEGGAGTPAAGEFRAAAFEAPTAIALAERIGVSTGAEMTTIGDAWRRWGASPGAFFAGFWVEAVAWVPPVGAAR